MLIAMPEACFSALLNSDKAHRWPSCRFGNGLCIGRVVLLAFDERLHIRGREQANLVPQGSDRSSPVGRTSQASIATTHPGCDTKNDSSLLLESLLAERHRAIRLCGMKLNTCFAISTPMMLTSFTDASFVATRHRNLGTSDAVGRPPPSLTTLTLLAPAVGVP